MRLLLLSAFKFRLFTFKGSSYAFGISEDKSLFELIGGIFSRKLMGLYGLLIVLIWGDWIDVRRSCMSC